MNHPIPKHLLTALLFTGAAWPLHAGAPPEITRHPVPQTAMAGSHVTLITGTSDVLATSFHWEKDGLPVPGATSNTLVLRHLQPRDAGDYQCIVGNNSALVNTITVSAFPPVAPPKELAWCRRSRWRPAVFDDADPSDAARLPE